MLLLERCYSTNPYARIAAKNKHFVFDFSSMNILMNLPNKIR